MNENPNHHLQGIAGKLLSLKSAYRLNRMDRETIETIVNTDIPLIQDLLKNERKARKTT